MIAVYVLYENFLWVRIWYEHYWNSFKRNRDILLLNVKNQHLTDWTEAEIQYRSRVSSHKLKQVIFKSHYYTLWVKDSSFLNISSVLSAQEQNSGDRFLHVFLQNGRPVVRLGCSGIHALTAAAPQNIRNNSLVPILVRWELFLFLHPKNIMFLVFVVVLKYVNNLKLR